MQKSVLFFIVFCLFGKITEAKPKKKKVAVKEQPKAAKPKKENIVLGFTANFKNNEAVVKDIIRGYLTYFKYVNENNIIKDKNISIILYDDEADTEKTISNIKWIKDDYKAVLFLGSTGDENIKVQAEQLKALNIPYFFPITGMKEIRDTSIYPNLFTFGSSYEEDITALVAYIKEAGIKNLTLIADNGLLTTEVNCFKTLIAGSDINIDSEAMFDSKPSLKLNDIVLSIKRSKPERILFFGDCKSASSFVNRVIRLGGQESLFLGISNGFNSQFLKEIETNNFNLSPKLLYTYYLPRLDSNNEVVRAYINSFKKYFEDNTAGYLGLEAYLSAKVIVELIQELIKKGLAITSENILNVANEFKDIDIGIGEKVNFSKEKHQVITKINIMDTTKTVKENDLKN